MLLLQPYHHSAGWLEVNNQAECTEVQPYAPRMKILVATTLDAAAKLVNAGLASSRSSGLGNLYLQEAEMGVCCTQQHQESSPNKTGYSVEHFKGERFIRYPNQNSKYAIENIIYRAQEREADTNLGLQQR